MNDLWQLQSDQHEQNAVEDERYHLPNRDSLKTHPPAQDPGRAPPVINAGDDYGQDTGDVEHLAAEVGNVRRQKREHGLDRRIVHALLHLCG